MSITNDNTISTALVSISNTTNEKENTMNDTNTSTSLVTTTNTNKENNTMNTNNTEIVSATPIVNAYSAPETETIRDRQAFARIPGWHEMGTTIKDHEPTTEEMYKLAGLDWTVSKQQAGFFDNAGFFHEIEDTYGLVRNEDNQFYGFCKNKYQIFQNHEAFGWCEPLVDSGLFKWETAGSFRNGQTCWCLLNSGEYNMVATDKIRNYLLVAWAHDGKRGIVIQPTSIRVICQNTLTAALTNKEERDNRVHIPHFVTMRPRLEEVRAMYEGACVAFEIQKTKYEKMINTILSESQKIAFIDSVCNIVYDDTSLVNGTKMLSERGRKHIETVRDTFKANLREMMDYRASGQMEYGIKNTLYGAFNASSEYIEHYMMQKGQKDGYSVLFGDRGKQIRQVEELANNWATGIDKFQPVATIA